MIDFLFGMVCAVSLIAIGRVIRGWRRWEVLSIDSVSLAGPHREAWVLTLRRGAVTRSATLQERQGYSSLYPHSTGPRWFVTFDDGSAPSKRTFARMVEARRREVARREFEYASERYHKQVAREMN